MKGILQSENNLCTGCNRCVRECPMETANRTFLDENGNIRVEVDNDKCIVCGWCISACKHDARHFDDDTERFFEDLAKGVPISLMVAPAIRTNIPEYKKLLTYLKRLGVKKIYDVSLGADISIWGHVKYIEKELPLPIITQPCPAIVTYLELYRQDLLPMLSPVHGPVGCTSVYMKRYKGISDRIALLSPCIAKKNELDDTGLGEYNVTFAKLAGHLEKNGVILPDEETQFDHGQSGLGALFPMPGGLKENIEYFVGNKLHIEKSEGFVVYEKMNEYAKTPKELLPDIFDVLNCAEGCNAGPAALQEINVFKIGKTMNARRIKATQERKKEYYGALYKKYDETFDFSHFLREYQPIDTAFPKITEDDISRAFKLLGKNEYEQQHLDCGACGSNTCYGMARKIALGVNIPENCIVKSKEDARTEHEENMRNHELLAEMEKTHEANERTRVILDTNPYATQIWDGNLKLIDCNQETLSLFRVASKQEFIEKFDEFSPEYQPDGRLSKDITWQYLNSAIKDGYSRCEWMHKTLDGEMLPCEITLVRVDFDDYCLVAVYLRDLREYKRMMKGIEKRDNTLSAINRVASVLLAESHEENFEKSLLDAMEIVGLNIEADRVQIWPNEMRDDGLHFVLKYQWSSEAGNMAPPRDVGTAVPYTGRWKDLFSRGECVNGPIAKLPQEDRGILGPLGLKSTITLPLFYHDEFWGIFCVDDVVKERYYTQDDIDVLKSASLMLVNAINRNLIQRELKSALERTEEVLGQNELQLAKLDMAIHASKVGLWEMEPKSDDPINQNNTFIWSDEFRQMLGYTSEGDFPNELVSWSDLLHPEDKERTFEAFRSHLYDIAGNTPYDIEYRLLKKDGEYSYYHAAGVTLRAKNGDPVRVVGTLVDITETKNIILDSERSRIQAEAANKAKSSFLSTMSHEIRTPMNAILGMTEIGKITNDVRKKNDALGKIDVASKHLLGIINDILDMSKIEADKFELSHESFDFEEMLQKVADVVNLRMDERRQKFFIHIDQDIPHTLIGDDQRLSQVITNLLSNAAKFTPEEGTIRLRTRFLSEVNDVCRLQITVEDTGIGITEEQKARLFKSFEQAESSTVRKYGGTGLGLAIAKRIVELMDGEIWADSEPGIGSTFGFTFTMRRGEDEERHLLDDTIDRENFRIFVVDGDSDTREFFMLVAENLGISCTVAESGEDAVGMLFDAAAYNVFFVEWTLSGMSGIELIRHIRAITADAPIVSVLSSADWNSMEDEARDAGLEVFLSKPLFPSMFVDVVNSCVSSGSETGSENLTGQSDDFSSFSVLLADDVEINREIVLSMLESTGLKIDCAENGAQVVKMFETMPDKYSLIFMDIQMPEMDGYDATRQIRALSAPQAKTIPIIAMTAHAFREDIDRCREVGMNSHISKPINFDEVMATLCEYMITAVCHRRGMSKR